MTVVFLNLHTSFLLVCPFCLSLSFWIVLSFFYIFSFLPKCTSFSVPVWSTTQRECFFVLFTKYTPLWPFSNCCNFRCCTLENPQKDFNFSVTRNTDLRINRTVKDSERRSRSTLIQFLSPKGGRRHTGSH